MSVPSWADLEAIFHEALARAPNERGTFVAERCAGRPDLQAEVEGLLQAHEAARGSEARRAAFVSEACAGNAEQRREVESLLAQDAPADPVFTRGAAAAAARLVSDIDQSVLSPRRLGAYQILGQIGAGGMGEKLCRW